MAGPTVRAGVTRRRPTPCFAIYAPVVHGSATTFRSSTTRRPRSTSPGGSRRSRRAGRGSSRSATTACSPTTQHGTTWRARAAAISGASRRRSTFTPTSVDRVYGRRVYAALLACLRLRGYRLALGCITLPNAGQRRSARRRSGFTSRARHRRCGLEARPLARRRLLGARAGAAARRRGAGRSDAARRPRRERGLGSRARGGGDRP